MYDLKTNLEPGNPDGHTVLRYLVEVKQMPLEVAIERVYHTVSKYAALYRADQKKLLTGMFVTGILGLPVFFPFGVSSLLMAGAIGASAFSWQEFGMMRDRLKPEYERMKKIEIFRTAKVKKNNAPKRLKRSLTDVPLRSLRMPLPTSAHPSLHLPTLVLSRVPSFQNG
jgi:hypothetical protein